MNSLHDSLQRESWTGDVEKKFRAKVAEQLAAQGKERLVHNVEKENDILQTVADQLNHLNEIDPGGPEKDAEIDEVKRKVLDTLLPLGADKAKQTLSYVGKGFEKVNERLKVMLRQWGINPKMLTPSDIELTIMLYADLRLQCDKEKDRPADDGKDYTHHFFIRMDDELLRVVEKQHLAKSFDYALKWKASGFARLSCGHKLAAALMMTTAPEEAVIEAPWPAWSLYVPNGLLPIEFSKNKVKQLTEKLDLLKAAGAKGSDPVEVTMDIGEPESPDDKISMEVTRIWCEGSEPRKIVVRGPGGCTVFNLTSGTDPMVQKSQVLMRNYVKGVCLTLDADVETHRKGSWGPKTGKRRTGKEPAAGTQYELGSPVQIDLRNEVRRYMLEGHGRGKHSPPKVQFLVRGHWRDQPCGPGRQDRRHIWIEPFWKGPEDARVLLRAHAIKQP